MLQVRNRVSLLTCARLKIPLGMQAWIEEMSAFLSLHDQNHLRTVGEEGAQHAASLVPKLAVSVAAISELLLSVLLPQDSSEWVPEGRGPTLRLGPL